MSIAHIKEWDALETCPYDSSHRVIARKFPNHVMKCERNRVVKLSVCPLNALHRFKEVERATHMDTCPDRVIPEREIVLRKLANVDSSSTRYGRGQVSYNMPEPEEDWVAESIANPVSAYDPTAAVNEAQFRNPATLSHMKRAEKKEFRRQLLLGNRPTCSTATGPIKQEDDSGDGYSVRLPREPPKNLASPAVRFGLGRGRGLLMSSQSGSAQPKNGLMSGRGIGLVSDRPGPGNYLASRFNSIDNDEVRSEMSTVRQPKKEDEAGDLIDQMNDMNLVGRKR